MNYLKHHNNTSRAANNFLAPITRLFIWNQPCCLKNRFKNIIKAPV